MALATGLVLQGQDNCPPGLLGAWAAARGMALDVLRVDRWGGLPDPSGYGCAIALGSSTSLAGPRPDWVAREVEWIRRADAAGVPVLGICFGAQALSVALGGSVARLESPECGWIELHTADPERVPVGPWLALHEDKISLPPRARELARNEFGVQAFTIGRHLGVQFHPEATLSLLARWIDDRRAGLTRVAGGLRAFARERGLEAAAAAVDLFDAFAAHAGLGLTTDSVQTRIG